MRLPKLIILALGLASGAFGQFETALVLGMTVDPRGVPIAQARVSLTNIDTGGTQSTVTNGEGFYQFLEVRVGRYRVLAEAAGFKKLETPIFRVDVGARQRVDAELEIGDVTETVQVEATASSVETDSSDRGQVINREAIVNLPLNGRSSGALTLLAPGVRFSYGQARRDSSFNINGQRTQNNSLILDGLDNNSYSTGNQGLASGVIQVAPDALQEFKVVTSAYSAEYGRVAGGVINASVRSGTNRLHASAWEYLRNTTLNATGFFKPVGGQKPVYIQNQFGVAAGGPIKKDKIFLFADYEGLRRLQRALSYTSVPTLDQRNGIFSVPVLNPYTGALYGNGVIPQSEITAFGRKVFADLPAPNLPGNTNNYAALLPATDNDDKGDIRYDHYVNNKIAVFSRYSQRVYTQLQPPNNGLPGPSGQGAGIFNGAKNKQSASGVTWTINPFSLLEFRFGASKTEGTRSPATLDGGPSMLALYGIPGLPTTKDLTGGLNTQNVTGYAPYGRDFASPQAQDPIVINPKINYSRIFGRHTLKIGYEFQAIDTLLVDFSPLYGQDTYNGQFSNPTPGKGNNLYNLADFLFGARSMYQLTNYTTAHLRQRMHFAYLQDDFKLSRRLTLNLGARYEFATPQYERDNHMTNYDPVTNSLVSAKNGSLSDRSLVNPAYKNWAPRLGFAYSLNPKTVIRSGYAISYVLFIRQGAWSVLAYNGPYVVNAQITQSPSQPLCGPNSPPLTCFRPTQLGYPDGFTSPANFSTANTKTIYIPKDVRTPYVQNWHFTIQRELAKNLVVDFAYVGNQGVGLWVNADLNQALPNLPNQSLPLKPRRPNAKFDYIATNFSAGFSTYHALQVKLEKRYSLGLYLLNSFTWSRAIDNAPGSQEAGNYDHQTINLFNFRASKGLSAYDQPFNNTTSLIWDLPFGRGRRFGSGMPYFVDGLLGGWALSGINTMTSGQTINLIYDPSPAFIATTSDNDTAAFYRPNLTGDPMMPAGQRSINRYLNPNTVQIPTNVTHPYGNAGRNIARSDRYYVLDLGIQKRFRLPGENRSLEFRTEMFNTLNKTNFSYPNSDRSSPSFGRITSAYPARQVQFALRFAF